MTIRRQIRATRIIRPGEWKQEIERLTRWDTSGCRFFRAAPAIDAVRAGQALGLTADQAKDAGKASTADKPPAQAKTP